MVFPGETGRKQAGYQLIKQGYADRIAITSGSERGAKRYADENGLAGLLKNIFCGNARSTFEDALFVGDLVTKQGFKSVILVTDDCHLPRASFLLRSVLADQGIAVYTYGISFEKELAGNNKTQLTEWKLMFDERVKFLGSLVEMGIYRVSGILINDYGWMIA